MCYKKKRLKSRILDEHRSGFDKEYINAPCGVCPACRKQKSNDWLVRSYFEFVGSDSQGFFITLDFDEEHLPRWYGKPCFDSEIMKRFLDRLRKDIGSFRYLYSTDYGGLLRRPHYHLACFPSKKIELGDFIRSVVDKWWYGSHTNIQLIDSVGVNKFKAIEYIVSYTTKDVTWHEEDFVTVSDDGFKIDPIPPRFRPRVQASKGYGLRALEEGIIQPADFLKEGVVAIPIGKNAKLVKFPIPRYYEMKLCYDYKWHPQEHKAELIKNDFGVAVSKHRHNTCYNHFLETFRASVGLPVHRIDSYKGSYLDGTVWSDVVENCLSVFDDFAEFVYYRPFINFVSADKYVDSIRNEVLIRPSWHYYTAAVTQFENYMKQFNDTVFRLKMEELIKGAKIRARARISRSPKLYNYLRKIHYDFSQLNY